MRSRRVALLGGALLTAAVAASPAAGDVTASPAARKERDVEVGARIVAEGGTLLLVGEVTGSKDPVLVQKATACRPLAFGSFRCDWRPYDEIRPARDGSYRAEVEVPEDEGHGFYWRATVGRDASPIWRTFRAEG